MLQNRKKVQFIGQCNLVDSCVTHLCYFFRKSLGAYLCPETLLHKIFKNWEEGFHIIQTPDTPKHTTIGDTNQELSQ